MRAFALFAAFTALAASGAPAQEIVRPLVHRTIDSGRVVRLHLDGKRVEVKLLQPLTRASNEVRYCLHTWDPCPNASDPNSVRVSPSATVARVEAHRNHAGLGFRIGGLMGALFGGTVGIPGPDFGPCRPVVGCHLAGAASFGLFAGAVGALIGGRFTKWVVAP